jgi:MHS family proline/betaine transporter-like MFS transporter
VGVLPGYAVLGVMAPFALTALRMIQGLSVGGEYTTSVVFMVERAPADRRGMIGAMACCGAIGGILLGSATGAILAQLMPTAALETWGWRIPFLLGLLVGIAGYFLRRTLVDTPRTEAAARSPLTETLRQHGPLLARLAGLSFFNAVGFYLAFVYIVSWLQFADGIAPAHALGINTISMVILLIVMVAMGRLSDLIGRRATLLMATGLGVVGAFPFFWLMHHDQTWMILLGQFGFTLAVGAFLGAQPTAMVEAAPVAVRCTVIALGYNVTMGVVGGLSPLVATWLVHRTGDDLSPAFLIMGAAAVSFLSTLFLKETSRFRLETA